MAPSASLTFLPAASTGCWASWTWVLKRNWIVSEATARATGSAFLRLAVVYVTSMMLLAPSSVAATPDLMRPRFTWVCASAWRRIGWEVTAALKLATKALRPLAPLYWLALTPPTSAVGATVAVAVYCFGLMTV